MTTQNIILTNRNEMDYTGPAVKGDGYYGYADGLHTISFHLKNFTGRVWLEATLLENPTEDDWFVIEMQTSLPYLQFTGETTARGISFSGNFVWLRASVDRSYLSTGPYDASVHGIFDKAVLLI